MAAPAHHAVATKAATGSCPRGTYTFIPIDQLPHYSPLEQSTTTSPPPLGTTVISNTTWQAFCQVPTGYSLDGFQWFEYEIDDTGLVDRCITYNATDDWTDLVSCQGLASQEWAGTDQHNCGYDPNNRTACEWQFGNAWAVLNYGNGYSLFDWGFGYSPDIAIYGFGNQPNEIWGFEPQCTSNC